MVKCPSKTALFCFSLVCRYYRLICAGSTDASSTLWRQCEHCAAMSPLPPRLSPAPCGQGGHPSCSLSLTYPFPRFPDRDPPLSPVLPPWPNPSKAAVESSSPGAACANRSRQKAPPCPHLPLRRRNRGGVAQIGRTILVFPDSGRNIPAPPPLIPSFPVRSEPPHESRVSWRILWTSLFFPSSPSFLRRRELAVAAALRRPAPRSGDHHAAAPPPLGPCRQAHARSPPARTWSPLRAVPFAASASKNPLTGSTG